MIYEGSRYEHADIYTISSHRAGYQPTVFREIPDAGGEIYMYMSEADSFEKIAHLLYNDPELWWVIADANPLLTYPDQIPAGTLVRVPSEPPVR